MPKQSKRNRRPIRNKPVTRKQNHQRPSVALTSVEPERPWLLTPDEITIVKNSVAKGASDEELKFCLTVAKRYRLDPFKQQIWFVKRWDSQADNGQGGKGANVWTPQVGINGLLFIASRDHKADFGSVSLPEYGPMVERGGIKAPEWARVKVWKKGDTQPTEAQAWWDEYAPADLSKAPFWKKMQRRMIAKCAIALAVRQAYPDLGGLYIPEEMERMGEDFTPSGRRIITQGEEPDPRAAQKAVAERKIAEAKQRTGGDGAGEKPVRAGTEAPRPTVGATEQPTRVSDPVRSQPQTPGTGPQTPAKNAKRVDITVPSESAEWAYIEGDIAEMVPWIQNELKGVWSDGKKLWQIPVERIPDVQAACAAAKYRFHQETMPVAPKPATSGPQMPQDARGPMAAPKANIPPYNPPASAPAPPRLKQMDVPSPRIMSCKRMEKGTKKWLSVVWGELELSFWKKDHWKYIEAGVGQPAVFEFTVKEDGDKRYRTLQRIRRIGHRDYDEASEPVRTLNDGAQVSLF